MRIGKRMGLAGVVVFLPIALVQGLIGKFLFQFGITICASVGLSLVEALTLTPMRWTTWKN